MNRGWSYRDYIGLEHAGLTVLAYLTATRAREIGVRMALGAARSDVVWMVLAQSMRLVAPGLALGIAGTYLSRKVIASQLYGVAPGDPVTVAGVVMVFVVVSLLATWVPARRAASLEPVSALRAD
jgi:ABC-type antimicrobial peptide transport system permease subunit